MGSERLDQVKSLIDRALALPKDQRGGFVRRACGGDEDLRLEVESLLDQAGAGRRWPEAPIVPSLKEPTNGQAPKLEPDERIGPYRVLGPLGEGGMGEVVLAVREDDFRQRVALKVVHPKYVSQELLHRFHEERQILAELQHPNIARILDGGTTGGDRPYFAMEYIEGSPIDAYCDRHGLDVRQRLELFVDVCRAIHLAHTNLVVHRDLKPSNILVTPGGAPKVIDFGIAKRIRPEGLDAGPPLTGLGRKPMTLRYAAPEQVEGRQITTATDVYALGVLLYELLTRRSPYDSETDLELADAIRGSDPKRPSTATQTEGDLDQLHLDRDLDAVILRAMRKEPDARYGSAEELAMDLQRYLDREPVLARRGTFLYRTGKFVRRHWLATSAAAALFLLAIGAPIHLAAMDRARAAAERAEAEAEAAQSLALREVQSREGGLNFMAEVLIKLGTDRDRDAALATVDFGRQRAKADDGDPRAKAAILTTLGKVYVELGDHDRAEALWIEAEALVRRHYPQGSPELAVAVNNLASLNLRNGDSRRAEALYREALAMKEQLVSAEELGLIVDIPKSTANLASALMRQGKYSEAEPLIREALLQRILRDGILDRDVAKSLRAAATHHFLTGDFNAAKQQSQAALDTFRQASEVQGKDVLRETAYASMLAGQGRILHRLGSDAEARKLLMEALGIRLDRYGDDHDHVALVKVDLARVDLAEGHLAEGKAWIEQAIARLESSSPETSDQLAKARIVQATFLAAEGRTIEAEDLLVRALNILEASRAEPDIYVLEARERLAALRSGDGASAEGEPT